MCLCEGKGWVPGHSVNHFPRMCLLCQGKGSVSDHRLQNVGMFPTPPYHSMGPERASRFLESYLVAKRLFEYQSQVSHKSYVQMQGDWNWPHLLKWCIRDLNRRVREGR